MDFKCAGRDVVKLDLRFAFHTKWTSSGTMKHLEYDLDSLSTKRYLQRKLKPNVT